MNLSNAPKGKAARTAAPRRRRKRGPSAVRRSRSRTRSGIWARGWRSAPWVARLIGAVLAAVLLSLAVNWIYQVVRKPSELLFPVDGAFTKSPRETWGSYQAIFRRYSTRTITAELLAALAQTEGSGSPLARTYWRWSWSSRPFEIYRPASSSVGMYQMTDGTFAEAKRLCIREHEAIHAGSGNPASSCGFNSLHFRLLPSHAVELTSAYLDRAVAETLARNRIVSASPRQQRHLAAAIHLCGAHGGDLYARNGFQFAEGQRCADHDPRAYLSRVDAFETEFRRLAARDWDG